MGLVAGQPDEGGTTGSRLRKTSRARGDVHITCVNAVVITRCMRRNRLHPALRPRPHRRVVPREMEMHFGPPPRAVARLPRPRRCVRVSVQAKSAVLWMH